MHTSLLSPGAWIITGGSHTGVMKQVGEAVRDFTLSSSCNEGEVVTVGIATWGTVHNREGLIHPSVSSATSPGGGTGGEGLIPLAPQWTDRRLDTGVKGREEPGREPWRRGLMPSRTTDPDDWVKQLVRLDPLPTTGQVHVGVASELPQVIGTDTPMRHGFRRGQGAPGWGDPMLSDPKV